LDPEAFGLDPPAAGTAKDEDLRFTDGDWRQVIVAHSGGAPGLALEPGASRRPVDPFS